MIPWNERELRGSIVKACSALYQKNLVAATDGNVSARLSVDRILVTPSGVSKGEVRELDILLCDMEGRKIRGRGEVSSEVHVHLAAYRARENIGAVVHAHPPTATAFTFAGLEALLCEPILPEVVAQIGAIPTAPYVTPGTRSLAESLEPYFKSHDIVMLAQHGAAAAAKDPWAAYLRMEKLEQFATILKSAFELAGGREETIKRMSHAQIVALQTSYGKGKLVSTCAPDEGSDDALIERIALEVIQRLSTAV